MTAPDDNYVTDEAHGKKWSLYLGDSCEILPDMADESIDLSVYSPPFQSLYTYSPSPRDLGNSATRDEFFAHYGYVIRELLRLTKTGRLSCVHTADVVMRKAVHGHASLYDFPGDVIRAHVDAGWLYYGRVMVDKNPQAAAVRTKAHNLLFVTKNKDSSKSSPGIGDSLLIFKKPGESAEPIKNDVTNEEWIEWAHPLWKGVRETHTLNFRAGREADDEKHLHPLQLDFIDRCVRLWSNPGERVLSPFAGVGSEVWMAVNRGRLGIGVELKPSYWRTAVDNLKALDNGQDKVGHDLRPPKKAQPVAVTEEAS
jgi:DNA modification methylase